MAGNEEQAARLLAEVKADPTGWSSLDLGKLLDLAGFERKTIEDAIRMVRRTPIPS